MRITTGMTMIASAIVATVLGLIIDVAPASAQAAPAGERFGARGQIIITSDLALDFEHSSSGDGGDDLSTYDFHAGFDRVVVVPLTIGARIGFDGWKSGMFDSRRRFDLGGRFGGVFHLGSAASFWPTLGFDYGMTNVGSREGSATVRTVTLRFAAPLFWEAARHVVIGAGPTFSRDLSASTGPSADQQLPKTTSFGIHGLIGLWF
jgi:hypothetical protein